MGRLSDSSALHGTSATAEARACLYCARVFVRLRVFCFFLPSFTNLEEPVEKSHEDVGMGLTTGYGSWGTPIFVVCGRDLACCSHAIW